MPAIKIFDAYDAEVPEGSSHEYQCEFVEASGAVLAIGAVQTIFAWLDALPGGTTINSRAAQDVRNLNGGSLVDGPSAVPTRAAGVGVFSLLLDPADAVIVSTDDDVLYEYHRLTLKVTYTRTGGGAATLTREVRYRVIPLARIT